MPRPERRRAVRIAGAVAGGLLLVLGVLAAIAGGLVLWIPAALLLALALPRRRFRYPVAVLVAGAGIVGAVLALAGGYFAYSCVRPEPVLVVEFRGGIGAFELEELVPHESIGKVQLTSISSEGNARYEFVYHRGAGDERDATLERLRRTKRVVRADAESERCD